MLVRMIFIHATLICIRFSRGEYSGLGFTIGYRPVVVKRYITATSVIFLTVYFMTTLDCAHEIRFYSHICAIVTHPHKNGFKPGYRSDLQAEAIQKCT